MTPEHFPPRLAQLGFQGRVIRGVEVILPPVCLVPAGPFLMGSDPERDPLATQHFGTRELPQHTVVLPAFEVACFPVTVAEYACFVRAGPQEPPANWTGDWHTQLESLDHPVVNVTWHDAVDYAAWLAEFTGVTWRLPSEAEWEKAARGTDGRIYPWGDVFDSSRCNTREGRISTTTPVGAYPGGASPYGAEDLAGNVVEWTSSWTTTTFLPYPYQIPGENEKPASSVAYVLRGGKWSDDAIVARAASRGLWQPDDWEDGCGFRLVRAASTS